MKLDYNTLSKCIELFNREVHYWTWEEANFMRDVLRLGFADLKSTERVLRQRWNELHSPRGWTITTHTEVY